MLPMQILWVAYDCYQLDIRHDGYGDHFTSAYFIIVKEIYVQNIEENWQLHCPYR